MAAAKEWGIANWERLDKLTFAMASPDMATAMIANNPSVETAYSSPPFTYMMKRNPEVHTVLSSKDVVGNATSALWYTSKRFHDANPKVYQAIVNAAKEAQAFIDKDLRTAMTYYLEDTGAKSGPEDLVDMNGAAVLDTAPVEIGFDDDRVAAVRLGQDLLVKGRGVVGAEQPQRNVRRHGHVQQRLVQLRLDDLLRSPSSPDRFANPANGVTGAAVLVGEVTPCGDDPRWVVTQLGHVGEHHPLGILPAQCGLERPQPGFGHGHHHRLSPVQPVTHERHHRVEEPIGPDIEQALVPIGLVRPGRPAPVRCR